MSRLRQIAAVGGTLFLLPLTACATTEWGRQNYQAAYSTGYAHGERAGFDDARRGDQFQFADESDYRNASRSRPRDSFEARSREEFLRGFEVGYRTGFGSSRDDRRGQVGPPPWSNGRGYGRGRTAYDRAAQYGLDDGDEAGLEDARDRRRFDPVGESRYRSGDRGYEREYGTRDEYRLRYRDAFRQGYEQGYYGRSR